MLWVFCRGTAKPAAIPHQRFDPRMAPIGEQKQVAAKRVLSELVAHQAIQPVKPFAHVDGTYREIDACSRAEAEHRLSAFRDAD
jgi:hypothetical protein